MVDKAKFMVDFVKFLVDKVQYMVDRAKYMVDKAKFMVDKDSDLLIIKMHVVTGLYMIKLSMSSRIAFSYICIPSFYA